MKSTVKAGSDTTFHLNLQGWPQISVLCLSALLMLTGCQTSKTQSAALTPSQSPSLTTSSSGQPVEPTATAISPTPTLPAQAAITPTQPCGATANQAQSAIDHVVWIVMENHGRKQIINNSAAPYFNSLISRCGYASNDHAVAHPSLPNYIAMTSGSTQRIYNDASPLDRPLNVPNIFSQLGEGHWKTLSENMPAPCYKKNSGTYVARHNPATYYTNLASQCQNQALPLSSPIDLTAPFTMIVPDQKSNTHDTSVAYGDNWLSKFVPTLIESSPYQAGRLVIFVTYDEDENSGDTSNPIATVAISPRTKPGTVDPSYATHYTLLRTTQELLRLPLLGKASTASSFISTFNLG